MKKIIFLALIILLTGCKETTTETGEKRINEAKEKVAEILIPETSDNLNFIYEYKGVSIEYFSVNSNIINNTGQVFRQNTDRFVNINVFFNYENLEEEGSYKVLVLRKSDEEILAEAKEDLALGFVKVEGNFSLPMALYSEIEISWLSSDNSILKIIDGIVLFFAPEKETTIILTAKLKFKSLETEKSFSLETNKRDVNVVNLTKSLLIDDFKANHGEFINTELKNDAISLKSGYNEGSYTSNVYSVPLFTQLVGSFSANTLKENENFSTVELLVRIKVGNNWSKYLSYGEFALYRNNSSKSDNSDPYAKMDVDIISAKNNMANAFQYKVNFKKELTMESAKLKSVAITTDTKYGEFPVSGNAYKETVNWEVPKLAQKEVPTIGNSICSPTSVAMLLKYKDIHFSEFDTFEHRYVAGLVYDHGASIYGNWVYNMAVAGEFTNKAYVAFLQSFDDLKELLNTKGPVAASIKGDLGPYNTNGHLLVVVGYKEKDGKTYVICNDPNIDLKNTSDSYVYYEYELSVFMNVWRKVCYVVE